MTSSVRGPVPPCESYGRDVAGRRWLDDSERGRGPDIAVGALAFCRWKRSACTARASRRWHAGQPATGPGRALYPIHAAGYLTAVFLVLSPVKAVVCLIVQQGLSGLYLGCSFAPTTRAMPVLAADDQRHFLRRHACGRGMDGKEDVELRAEAGNSQEPASWARARSAARRHQAGRHHARCPSNGGAAVSRHLIRDRPVTSRLAAGGAGQGVARRQQRCNIRSVR